MIQSQHTWQQLGEKWQRDQVVGRKTAQLAADITFCCTYSGMRKCVCVLRKSNRGAGVNCSVCRLAAQVLYAVRSIQGDSQ